MRGIEYFKRVLYQKSKGFVAVAFANEEQWWENIYRVKELSSQMTIFENNKDINIYTSVNSFYQARRSFESLYNLNSLFCDIDCVKHGIPIKEAFKDLINLWIDGIIPEPSLVIDSGRGLHVYWFLDNCFASTKDGTKFITTYQALLNRFARILAYLGADFKSAEPSRVLGVPDTYNIKSGTRRKIIKPQVELIEKGVLHERDIRYKIIELADKFLNTKAYREKKVTFEKRQTAFNELTLAYARMEDYKTLIHLRNTAKVNEGYRNQLLYDYGLENIDYTKTKENLHTSLYEINSMFRKPLETKELGGIIKSLEGSKFKKIKNQTIIEQLEISVYEQQKMRTLIEREIKVARYVEKKKIARRNENGLTKRKQSREDNIYLILDSYYIQNRTRKQIADNLKISVANVKKYLDVEITIEEKILFLLDKKVSKRKIMKIFELTQYTLEKILKN